MSAPTFVQEAETVWNDTTDKTTASFSVQAGDILVAYALGESHFNAPFAINGGSLTWTLRENVYVTNYAAAYIWTATVDSNKSMTVTVTDSHTDYVYGLNVLTFRGSSGVGTSNKGNSTTGDPAVTLTGVQADSAIVMANADWEPIDGSTREYNTAQAGSFTEQTYYYYATKYCAYGGAYQNAGAAGDKTVGINLPDGQTWSLVAVEIKGTAFPGVPWPRKTKLRPGPFTPGIAQ